MVIASELRLRQYWDDDHREDAPHFSNFVSPEVLKRLYRKVIFWFLWECSKVLFWIIKRKWFFAWLIRIKYWIWDVNSKNSPTRKMSPSPRSSSSNCDELENQSFKLALFLMNKQMMSYHSFFRTHVALLSRPWVTFCLAVENSSLIQDDSEFGSWPTLCVDYSMGYESHLWVISNDSSMWITPKPGVGHGQFINHQILNFFLGWLRWYVPNYRKHFQFLTSDDDS